MTDIQLTVNLLKSGSTDCCATGAALVPLVWKHFLTFLYFSVVSGQILKEAPYDGMSPLWNVASMPKKTQIVIG